MKTKFKIAAATISLAIFVMSCNQSSKKDIEKANENLKAANKNLGNAVKDADSVAKEKALTDWVYFKKQSDSVFVIIENEMASTRSKMAKANTKEKLKLNKELGEANQHLAKLKGELKNEDDQFKKGIVTLSKESKARNESFKREFNHDSKELVASIKDLFKDNVKY